MKRIRSVGIVVGGVILCAAMVAGQESPPVLDPVLQQPVPEGHQSPRATMTTFLEAFYAVPPDLDAATGCLDLEEIPRETRAIKGRELAVKLKDVLDRTILIDVVKISDATDGEPHVVLKVADGEIVIDRDDNGEWLFTLDSLASLTTLWEAVRDRPVLTGVEAMAPTAVTPGTWLQSRMPGSLRSEFMYLEFWQWLGILLIVIIGVVCGRIFSAITARVLERFLRKHETVADHEASVRAIEPLAAVVMVLVWGLGVVLLGLPMGVFTLYYRVIKVVAVAAVVFSAYRFADVLSDLLQRRARRTKTHYDDMLVPLVRKSIKVFVVTAGLLTVAQVLGTNLTALFASVGIGGLALALAAQDTVSNFFGSLMVILDRPFQVGDWIKTGDVEGTVEEVGFRSTRVRTFYNSLITLPNANLIKASVDNLGSRTYRRWVTRLGIAYDTPPEKVDAFCEGVRELVRKHPYTRKDYFHIYFNEFGRDSLEVLVYVFFFTPDWGTELRERHRLGVDIIRLASELDVEFAFPTQTLHLRSEDWIGQTAAGDEYPAVSADMQKRARGIADQLVADAVGDEIPPPVQFDRPPEQDGGSE
jgi:MscS family membrane protein